MHGKHLDVSVHAECVPAPRQGPLPPNELSMIIGARKMNMDAPEEMKPGTLMLLFARCNPDPIQPWMMIDKSPG